ncbi:MAG: CNP1-like family protein [Burkholderiales bacterium]
MVAAGLLSAIPGTAARAQPEKSEWERHQEELAWREIETPTPAYPRPENLLPFYVSAASDFSFFVDTTSISVGEDGVVRYVLVARSAQGAQSVSFEGIRCSTSEYRIYATGVAPGRWAPARAAWRAIDPRRVARWHNALAKEYFCPSGRPIRGAAEGVLALRRGDHPSRALTGD